MKAMFCVTALYPNRPGSRFDAAYYAGAHADLAREMLAAHAPFELSIAIGEAALDGAPPPFWAISEMRFASRDAFDAAMAACGPALFADAANYTDVDPVLQISRPVTPPAFNEEPSPDA